MAKEKFKKNKLYYLPEEDCKLKYKEQDFEQYYIFKMQKHEIWDEYLTKDGSEIYENKTAYQKEIKDE